MERIANLASEYFSAFRLPKVGIPDVVEIILLAFILYEIMVWVKNTRAWSIVKGLAIVLVFMAIAVIFDMTTIIWLAKSLFTLVSIAIIVALQPEIRRLIEDLGHTNIITAIARLDDKKVECRFSDKTLNEIIVASYEMGRAKTGALIVIECDTPLGEYERTGIAVDAVVTSQLLINIFEHNTPLHDGAVIVRGDRVAAATCYLPLSDNRSLSKELGTRHRAAVGISENTDSMTVIVSEETGKVSVAYGGEIYRALEVSELRKKLEIVQDKRLQESKFSFFKRSKKDDKEDKKEEPGKGENGLEQKANEGKADA
ncbi:MAG: diadenylate cyclase CdaA [Lachnospiraceae bacterium]|nr:diadenylate cyclase CdaA [Lachnospiraceae bacterium]